MRLKLFIITEPLQFQLLNIEVILLTWGLYVNVLCININSYPPYSAGAGRTGAIITIHAMMQMTEEKKEVDIYNFVFSMRNSRPNIVQTSVRFIFSYLI